MQISHHDHQPSWPSTIMSISHHEHQPSWASAIMTISHHDHQSSWPSAIHPWCQSAISHQDHQPSCNSSMMPICHQTPPLPLPLCHHAIMSIIHHPLPLKNKPSSAYKNYAYQPSCNPSMMPICHNPPPRLIEPIDHWAYQPSSLLTLALLSRLLSLSACFSCLLPNTNCLMNIAYWQLLIANYQWPNDQITSQSHLNSHMSLTP